MATVKPPAEILLVPWGETNAGNVPFRLDSEAADLVIQAFKAHGADLPIDYGHASLGGKHAFQDGTAPAAGWIKSLRAVPGRGLLGAVEWTKDAAAYIADRGFRYISPVVLTRAADRRVVKLHSAGLTNRPEVPHMPPLDAAAV